MPAVIACANAKLYRWPVSGFQGFQNRMYYPQKAIKWIACADEPSGDAAEHVSRTAALGIIHSKAVHHRLLYVSVP